VPYTYVTERAKNNAPTAALTWSSLSGERFDTGPATASAALTRHPWSPALPIETPSMWRTYPGGAACTDPTGPTLRRASSASVQKPGAGRSAPLA